MLRGCTQRRTCPACHNGLELMRKGHQNSTCREEEKPVPNPGAIMWLSSNLYSHLLIKIYLSKGLLKEYLWEWSFQRNISGQWRNSQTQWIIIQVNFMFLPMNFGGSGVLASLEKIEKKTPFFLISTSCIFKGELYLLANPMRTAASMSHSWLL